jgi:chemotaxis protein CheZ
MTRKLHDALHELGYDKSLERAASTIPDAKDRLAYIASLTENAAMRALNATDQAGPHQDSIEKGATALSLGWDKLYAGQLSVDEFKLLSQHTRDYLASVPSHTQATRTQLMEIIMAQDFQDLTGQVIKKIVEMVQHMESELLAFLMEFSDKKMESKDNGLLNGPVVNAEGRTDVVTSQQQVDDLLEGQQLAFHMLNHLDDFLDHLASQILEILRHDDFHQLRAGRLGMRRHRRQVITGVL